MTEETSVKSEVFTPKKSNLSRKAIAQNAFRKSLAISSPNPLIQSDARPSYSSEALTELRQATPSTPKDIENLDDSSGAISSRTLDISSKFGNIPLHQLHPSIPTDAEVQEKKLRRARLAKEQKYTSRRDNSSSGSDSDNSYPRRDDENDRSGSENDEFRSNNDIISLAAPSRSKYPGSRLTYDDEDLFEGDSINAFVSDGRIALSRHAEREAKRRQRAEVAELIADAEDTPAHSDSDDGSEDSEKERHAEYETTQTRKGMEGLVLPTQEPNWGGGPAWTIPQIPPKITPLPTLDGCLERLKARLAKLVSVRAEQARAMAEIGREKAEISNREGEIQRMLTEAGQKYERLLKEAGGTEYEGTANGTVPERGLENLGNDMRMGDVDTVNADDKNNGATNHSIRQASEDAPWAGSAAEDDEMARDVDDDDESAGANGHAGLGRSYEHSGMGMTRTGLGSASADHDDGGLRVARGTRLGLDTYGHGFVRAGMETLPTGDGTVG